MPGMPSIDAHDHEGTRYSETRLAPRPCHSRPSIKWLLQRPAIYSSCILLANMLARPERAGSLSDGLVNFFVPYDHNIFSHCLNSAALPLFNSRRSKSEDGSAFPTSSPAYSSNLSFESV